MGENGLAGFQGISRRFDQQVIILLESLQAYFYGFLSRTGTFSIIHFNQAKKRCFHPYLLVKEKRLKQ